MKVVWDVGHFMHQLSLRVPMHAFNCEAYGEYEAKGSPPMGFELAEP